MMTQNMNWFTRFLSPKKLKPKRILSIDGGGVRGIIPATILVEIERLTQKPISKLFDLMAGTSTGAILSLGIAVDDGFGSPKYSANDLLEFYFKRSSEVFPDKKQWSPLKNMSSLTETKYDGMGLKEVLTNYFDDSKLSEALVPSLVTSYDLQRRQAFIFDSREAVANSDSDFSMLDILLATTAAPTYFPPHKITVPNEDVSHTLVDGGVWANNPALLALVESRFNQDLTQNTVLLSLGTGNTHKKSIDYEKAKSWGQLGWVEPLLDITFQNLSDNIHTHLIELLPTKKDQKQYYRFQTELDKIHSRIDDCSPEYLEILHKYGLEIIKNNTSQIELICSQLLC